MKDIAVFENQLLDVAEKVNYPPAELGGIKNQKLTILGADI